MNFESIEYARAAVMTREGRACREDFIRLVVKTNLAI
jgi:hypothetical protein